jgi:hypothetical protein
MDLIPDRSTAIVHSSPASYTTPWRVLDRHDQRCRHFLRRRGALRRLGGRTTLTASATRYSDVQSWKGYRASAGRQQSIRRPMAATREAADPSGRSVADRHHSEALKLVSRTAILHQARRLGLADGKSLILDSMDELTPVFDLAVHTAPAGRFRTIDRYARSTRFETHHRPFWGR